MNEPHPSARRIVNHVRGTAERTLFDPAARDHITEPYIKLRETCKEYRFLFEGVCAQPLDECKWILFWDTWRVGVDRPAERLVSLVKARLGGESYRDLFREATRANLYDRLVLLMFEPPCVFPRNYDMRLHQYFKIIFTWDPTLVDGKKYHRIYVPNPTSFPPVQAVPFSEKKLLVDISAYKFSGHPRELYSERRRVVRFFERHYPDQFDLYGEGWNPTLTGYLWRKLRDHRVRREFFPSYRGPVGHKWDIYPRYKFGVCYENILDQPGYVSIKIFDCMRAGCVPIYLGAPDIRDYVDTDAFIDRRAFRSLEQLGKHIAAMGKQEYEAYVAAGQRYLRSDRFRPFLADNFVDTIMTVLDLVPRHRPRTELAGARAESEVRTADKFLR